MAQLPDIECEAVLDLRAAPATPHTGIGAEAAIGEFSRYRAHVRGHPFLGWPRPPGRVSTLPSLYLLRARIGPIGEVSRRSQTPTLLLRFGMPRVSLRARIASPSNVVGCTRGNSDRT